MWFYLLPLVLQNICPFKHFSEIPLFHVLNARVTFSNLCGCDEPVNSVTVHKREGTDDAGNICLFVFGLRTCHIVKVRVDSSYVQSVTQKDLINYMPSSSPRSLSPSFPLWGGPFSVWTPSRLHHPRPRAQRANEGRGRQPAAVRHPAEPFGCWHREWPGQI